MANFKMTTLLCIILTICIHVACTMDAQEMDVKETTMARNTYLALGDSYTIGEGVPLSESFPYQLVRDLNKKSIGMKDPLIIAVTGWTTTQLLSAISEAKLEEPYSLVTLLIGVNNQYQNQDIEIYKREFEELLTISIQLAGNRPDRVVVISIPDYGITPFAQNRDPDKIGLELDSYNKINLQISKNFNTWYVNITDISRSGKGNSTFLAADQLHPSSLQYKLWVERISDIVGNKIFK